MHVSQYGSGTRAYYGIHGWAGNHRTFKRFSRYLVEGACLYCPDLPGYGRSPDPPTWERSCVLDELADSISNLHAEQLTLVGHCGGALFAAALAQRQDISIDRIVLIDPFAYLPWYFAIFLQRPFGRRAYHATFATSAGRWLTNGALAPRRSRHTNITEAFERVRHDVTYEYLRMMASFGHARKFAGITCDVDLAYGERTFKAIRHGAAIWKEAIPQTRILILKGAGHEPIKEATDQLARILFRPEQVWSEEYASRQAKPKHRESGRIG